MGAAGQGSQGVGRAIATLLPTPLPSRSPPRSSVVGLGAKASEVPWTTLSPGCFPHGFGGGGAGGKV